jgi:hypothetical protein
MGTREEGIRLLQVEVASICSGGFRIIIWFIFQLAMVVGLGDGWARCLLCSMSSLSCCSLPCWPAMAARSWKRVAVARAAISRALLGRVSSWQLGRWSAEALISACLLPPVAGAGVSTAGLFSPSAAVEWRPLHHLSSIAGVGSPLLRAPP